MKTHDKKDLVVVKVGTNVLADTLSGAEKLDDVSFANIGTELRQLSDSETGVVLVSSGAITAGVLSERKRREEIDSPTELQRYAARGWDSVVQKWKLVIGSERVSSTLLTKRELRTDSLRSKALDVINCCLTHGDIFIVNENDTLSDDEIKFGDNDTLAAALAAACAGSSLFRSVKLVLLTNVNGFNRVASDGRTLIRTVHSIDSVASYAGTAENGHSRGGMLTKVRAAATAKAAGVETYIANGRIDGVIGQALRRETGTYFPL